MPGKTVLVIDTDIETEDQIMSTLESAGYLVFAAQTDDVLSENALKVSPSLMFFSPSESGALGLETCRMLHQTPSFRGIPIIVITPFDDAMDPGYPATYGVVDIVRIPFEADDLLRRTDRALSAEIHASAEAEEAPAPYCEPEETGHAEAGEMEEIEEIAAVETGPLAEGAPEMPARAFEPEETYPEPQLPRRKKGSGILVPALIVGVIAMAGAGVYFYKDLIFKPKKATTVVAVKPAPAPQPQPVQPAQQPEQPQQAAVAPSAPVAQNTGQPAQQKPAAAAPAAQTKGKDGLSVQLGAFKDASKAEALAKRYKEKGYDSFVKKTESKDKGVLHRVLVGRYSDAKECRKMAATLKAKEKVQAVIYNE